MISLYKCSNYVVMSPYAFYVFLSLETNQRWRSTLTLKWSAYCQFRLESLLEVSDKGYVQRGCYEKDGAWRKRYPLLVVVVSDQPLLSSV